MIAALRHRLGSMLMITDAEWREMPALTAALGIMVGGAVLGFSAANALFMKHVGNAALPWTFVLTAAAMLVCTPLYVWMSDHLRRPVQVTVTFLLSAAALGALSFFLRWDAALWIYMILTMVVHSFTSLAFWLVSSDCYDPRQAKRLFHVIAAGGSVGAIVAGGAARWVSLVVPTHLLSLLWAACLVVALGLIGYSGAFAKAPPPSPAEGGPLGPLRDSLKALRLLKRVPVAPPLVWTTGLGVFIGWLINYQFNVTLMAAYPNNARAFTDYFAEMAAVVSVSALVAQLGIVGRVMSKLGLVGTMYVAPALLLGPAIVLGREPTLAAATTCRFLEQFFGIAVVSTCVDTLSAAIPAHQRPGVMTLLRTVVTPIAMGGAGILLVLSDHVLPQWISRAIIPILVVAWMFVLIGLRRRYLDTLISNLSSDDEATRLASLSALGQLTDEAVDRLLVQSLSSPNPDTAVFALELLREPGFERLASSVPPCLESPHAEVRAEAIRTLAFCAPDEAMPRVWPLLADADARVRRAALEAADRLVAHRVHGPEASGKLLDSGAQRLREETDPALAAAHVCSMAQAGWSQDDVHGAIRGMVARPWREAAALALRAVRADDPPDEVEALLRDDDFEVRRAAARSLRGPYDGDTLAVLVAMLREPSLSDAAAEALSTCGAGGVALLRHTLEVEPSITTRARLCEVLGRIATPDALDAVVGSLQDRAARVRVAAARVLREVGVPMIFGNLQGPLVATAEHLVVTSVQLRGIPPEERRATLLRDELQNEMDEARHALSILISLAAWGCDQARAHGLLESATEERDRGISLELVENALQGVARAVVMSVIEAREPERLAQLEMGTSGRWRAMSPGQMLAELARSEDRWVAQCARWAIEEDDGMLTLMEKILFLRQVELFRGIPGRDLAVVAELATEESYERNQTIFEQGAPGDALYLVTSGSVAVLSGERIIAIFGERDCFGEMAILTGDPRSATIRALDETQVLTISRNDFRQLIVKYPHIAFPIFDMLAKRLKHTTELLRRDSVK